MLTTIRFEKWLKKKGWKPCPFSFTAYWGNPEIQWPRYFHTRWTPILTRPVHKLVPDIHRKLPQLEKGPETPQQDLLEIAFKVFNNREEEAKKGKENERKAKYALFAAALQEKKFNPFGPSTSAHPYGT